MSDIDQMRMSDQPRPEDSAAAINRLQNTLASTTVALGSNLLQELDKATPGEKWSMVTQAIENVEHVTAEKFYQIAIVVLREVLTRQPSPTSDEVLAHFMTRIEEEIARIKPPQY